MTNLVWRRSKAPSTSRATDQYANKRLFFAPPEDVCRPPTLPAMKAHLSALFLICFDHANEDVPTAEDKVVKPSRRLSLVIWFRGTQRVAARARRLVGLTFIVAH